MATIRPNSTPVNQWFAGRDHTDVDEEVVQPNAGNQGTDVIAASDIMADDGQIESFGFPDTINDVDEVTNITVWSNGWQDGGNSPEVKITGEDYVECTLGGAFGWTSDSFDVSWNQSELNALVVTYRADVPNKNDTNTIDVCYVVVTYSQAAGGWGHKMIGVAGASIGKVSGVLIGNIGKIKGVA